MIRRIPVYVVMIAVMLCSWTAAADSGSAGTVNINTADADELQLLPRVGPSLAQRIVDFRETNGLFKETDELVAVRGIGEKSLAAMKPYLSVEGDTTLSEKIKLPRTAKQAETSS